MNRITTRGFTRNLESAFFHPAISGINSLGTGIDNDFFVVQKKEMVSCGCICCLFDFSGLSGNNTD
ncbi:MAG: hypothetical protein HQM10_25955 [Candidatus Riflebacteria bacterium]|nr:hypothetical protein [Candidatus Riflebacteria bacterium]